MQRIGISGHFQGTAAEPAGDPPRTDPRAESVIIAAVDADGVQFEIERASYSNQATYTGESTFTEVGTINFGQPQDEIDIETVGEGTLGPSADSELLHGAVIYRIVAGRGRFSDASGLIISNFLLRPADGTFDERQLATVFMP
jgi:hypothetical protein